MAMHATDETKHQSQDIAARSHLLSLPLELRTMIYTYILVHPLDEIALYDSHIQNIHQLNGRNYPVLRHRFCANILKTCRQIKEEATPVLYGQNLFQCHPSLLGELPSLLLIRRPVHIVLPPVLYSHLTCQIRRLYMALRLDTDPNYNFERVVRSLSGLDELRLEVWESMYCGSDFSALKMFEGVRGVRKAKVYGSISDGSYAQWLEAAMMSPVGAVIDPYVEVRPVHHQWKSLSDGNP